MDALWFFLSRINKKKLKKICAKQENVIVFVIHVIRVRYFALTIFKVGSSVTERKMENKVQREFSI